MGVYKEPLIYLEKIARDQKRIYPDACDAGVIVTGTKDPVVTTIKDWLYTNPIGLDSLKKKTETWGDERTGRCQSTSVFIPFEVDEGYYRGVRVLIGYHQDNARKIKFISVDFDYQASQKDDPYK